MQYRISRGNTAIAALALVGVGLLAGCGSTGSTAASTSTPQPSVSQGAAGSGAQVSAAPGSELVQAPPSVGPMPTGSGQAPQAPPSGAAAGTPPPPLGPKETGYLDALERAGITPGDPQAEINVARLICLSIQQNQPMDQLAVIVNAVAGSDAKAAGKPATDDTVAQLGQTYINTAKATYCR